MSEALNWRTMPLTGRVLIEASAGTGKTYTIGLIVLRLLLESGHRIEQLLVCTFTDAAAQELRERIRARLVDVESLLENWPLPAPAAGREPDPLHEYLRVQCGADPDAALLTLRAARLDLDRAAIGTIHGFLGRVLREHPFLCGGALAAEERVDETELLSEAFDDFRRHCLQGEPVQRPPFRHLLQSGSSRLFGELQQLFNNPDAALLLPAALDADTLLQRERALQAPAVLERLRAVAAGEWGALRWKARATFPQLLLAAIDALASTTPLLTLDPAVLEDVSDDCLARALPKAAAEAARPAELDALVALCSELSTLRESLHGHALAAAHDWCRQALRQRAEARGLASFSQLVERVADAIAGPNGELLAAALAEAWPHALIDEFQDTDQRQFGIFERIYRGRGSLHLIGDPKQAIYGFRGGDVEAYLRAAATCADSRWTLTANYRSAPSMVAAVNALYRACGDGFDHPQIRFHEVSAGRKDAEQACVTGSPARLLLHVDDSEVARKGDRREAAYEACAAQIAALLSGQPDENGCTMTLDGQPPTPGRIAVLLPSNQQIAAMRAALERRGVPCVGAGRQSVLASAIAEELQLLLFAALQPGDGRAVRAALGTSLLGVDHDGLLALEHDLDAADAAAVRFERWGRLWRERGPLALVEAVQREQAAAQLARGDGERRLTDLRHLGELLQDEVPRHAGPSALFDSFCRQRGQALDGKAPDEQRQLRLESDSARVRLMTLHGCKGLQFDLVFLPLAFDGRAAPSKLPRFHADDGTLCFDAGSAQFAEHQQRALAEDRQERLRLLYVALTRAVHACHLYWHPGDGDSAFAMLAARIADRLPAGVDDAAVDRRVQALRRLAADSGVIGLRDGWPALHEGRYRAAPTAAFERRARSDWPAARPPYWLYSFSSLARQAHELDDGRAGDDVDHDGADPLDAASAADPRLQQLAGLRGLGFGNALHALFELSPPAQPLWPAGVDWIGEQLRSFGVGSADRSESAIEALAQRIDAVRAADLGGGLQLAHLPGDDAVAEFGFHFPLHGATPAQLRAVCSAHGEPWLIPAGLGQARLEGMMGGAIDLVLQHDGRFHLLDYKSNWLGAGLADYRPAALDAAMQAAHYPLQALIYAVALHRYLQRRVTGYAAATHLGDAIYLFVRAVGLEPAQPALGIWRHRFAPALIEAVDRLFDGGEPDDDPAAITSRGLPAGASA